MEHKEHTSLQGLIPLVHWILKRCEHFRHIQNLPEVFTVLSTRVPCPHLSGEGKRPSVWSRCYICRALLYHTPPNTCSLITFHFLCPSQGAKCSTQVFAPFFLEITTRRTRPINHPEVPNRVNRLSRPTMLTKEPGGASINLSPK